MRGSRPMPRATSSTSAPDRSHTLATELMKLILVARKALEACLMSSAVARSVARKGAPERSRIGWYSSRRAARPRSVSVPTTTRSGSRVSTTAEPSRRNSGLEATSQSAPGRASRAMTWATRSPVCTGTVDFSQTSRNDPVGRAWATSLATASRYWRLGLPSARLGVPTQMKITWPWRTASPLSAVNRSRPAAIVSASSSGSPGSWNQGRPARSCSSLARSSSLVTTSCPIRARHAAVTSPTCPAPMTATCMLCSPSLVAGDVGKALGGPADPVVAADHRAAGVLVDPDAVLAAGSQVAGVPGDLVAPAPAGRLHVDLEAVLGAEAPPVPLDRPGVALDVDPGVGPGHVPAGEDVAADRPGAGPLLEVDALGGDLGADPVAEDPVAVAPVGLAAAVLAPVAVGAAHVDALAVPGLAQDGVV